MTDFFFRTEDIRPDEVVEYFVESRQDRAVVDALKNRNPTILVGSRGVGKSFLLRVAQKEMQEAFERDRVFPVYLSFVRGSLLHTKDPEQFKHWMLARVCAAVLRALMKAGLLSVLTSSAKILAGTLAVSDGGPTRIEELVQAYENSWKKEPETIDDSTLPTIDNLKEALEDLTIELKIKRFSFLFDEAAHIFVPEQQRQFFTLFRDLRSHYLTCNAAVYPGVTNYGETFQPAHDATMLSIDRDVLSKEYVTNMREIVEKQADSALLKNIAQNSKNFAVLAYAASGNPRLLLKTIARAPKVNSAQVNEIVREYYRSDIWAEHTLLAEKYVGHREVIDWGRQFLEGTVIPEIKSKNDQYVISDKSTSAYFWIHRDAPAVVKEALRVLSYTGVVGELAAGMKATRGEIGTRYIVNLGCLFSLEQAPALTSFVVAKGLTPKRMTEFGSNHSVYKRLVDYVAAMPLQSGGLAIKTQLLKSVDVLDVTEWQRSKLFELNLSTVGDVLAATDAKLKEAAYVGEVRARRMKNAAEAAVLEYLSG